MIDPTLAAALMPYLIALPIIVPALGAAGCLIAAGHVWLSRVIALSTLSISIVISITMVVITDLVGITTLQIGGWDAPVGITLVADRLSTIMLAVSSLVITTVMWYAIGQRARRREAQQPNAVFLPAYLLLSMGVNIAFLAGDLFNLYVGFEVLLVSSYVLLTIGASASRVRAGVGYVMVSMLSSLIFVVGIGLTYAACGTLNFAQLSIRFELVPAGTRTAIFAVLLVAFGIKAAIFPLYSWLPDSYPTAPVLVSAVFAGLLTKVGVYSIIRMRMVVFTDGRLDQVLMWAAIFTMLLGILGAMAQNDIKRLLSFTLVSHIGYMLVGVASATSLGLSGAIFYTVHHIVVQTTLFLVVGLIEYQAGTSSLRKLGSLAYVSPMVAVFYLIPALNLGGIPPLSGFLGKVILLQALAQDGGITSWIAVVAAVVTSLLTLYTMTVVWQKAFWRDRRDAPDFHPIPHPTSTHHEILPTSPKTGGSAVATKTAAKTTQKTATAAAHSAQVADDDGGHQRLRPLPRTMIAPTAVMVAVSLAITVLAGPLSAITGRSAESAQDVSNYRAAVLGADYTNPARKEDLSTTQSPSTSRPDDKTNRGDGIIATSSTPTIPTETATPSVTSDSQSTTSSPAQP